MLMTLMRRHLSGRPLWYEASSRATKRATHITAKDPQVVVLMMHSFPPLLEISQNEPPPRVKQQQPRRGLRQPLG